MARKPRFVRIFLAVHATARGVNGCALFRNDNEKIEYLTRFKEVAEQEEVEIHAYCLLRNHVHFLLVPRKEGALARLFLRVHTWWAQTVNRRHKRQGHLFQGRFYSCVLDKAHYWAALRYIDTNPRKHKLTKDLVAWQFSSARQHLTGQKDELVDLQTDAWHHRFTPQTYAGFLEESDREPARRLEQSVKNGMPCGSAHFVRRLERKAGRRLHALPPGRLPKLKPHEQLKTFAA